MAIVLIRFIHPLNVSVQITDILYGTKAKYSGINNPHNNDSPEMIGEIVEVDHFSQHLRVETNLSSAYINTFSHLFFNKNKAVSVSGILGYYALTEYRNYSKNKAEIFATGTEYAPSSK